MYVKVDLDQSPPTVGIAEPDDCARFHVAVFGHGITSRGDATAVDDALAQSGVGEMDGDGGVLVRVDALRALVGEAEEELGGDWSGRFAAMLDHAAEKGWLSADREAIRAHLEWG